MKIKNDWSASKQRRSENRSRGMNGGKSIPGSSMVTSTPNDKSFLTSRETSRMTYRDACQGSSPRRSALPPFRSHGASHSEFIPEDKKAPLEMGRELSEDEIQIIEGRIKNAFISPQEIKKEPIDLEDGEMPQNVTEETAAFWSWSD